MNKDEALCCLYIFIPLEFPVTCIPQEAGGWQEVLELMGWPPQLCPRENCSRVLEALF